MQSINILDMRTLLMGNVVCSLICVVVLAILWRYNRDHFPATENWLRSLAMQFVGLSLIVLRGTVSDFLSIMVSAFLIVAGIMQLYIGLERFLERKRSSQCFNYALLLVFLLVHAYFTYIEPSLKHRASNYSVFLALFSAQCAWLLLFRIKPEQRMGTTLVGGVMAAYGLLNLGRIGFYAFVPPSNDLFCIGIYDALMYLAYQVLLIALTFGLVLMVNRRLHAQLEGDLEQRKQSEAAVRLSESRLTRAELAAKSGNWELHLDSRAIVTSPGAARVYGIPDGRFDYETIKAIPLPEYRPQLDRAMSDLIQQGAPYDIEFSIRAADTGEVKDIHSIATFDPEARKVFGVVQDISARKKIERELERLVQVDQLTGVFSRRHFMSLAERELARAIRYGEKISVLMVDIDRFKNVNDTYGHQVGDRVLREVGLIFWAILREADMVGRVGGEEFAVVLPQTEAAQAMEVAERLRHAVEHTAIPLDEGLPLGVSISVGVAPFSGSKTSFDTLLTQADKALYEAKHQGRNRVCLFSA